MNVSIINSVANIVNKTYSVSVKTLLSITTFCLILFSVNAYASDALVTAKAYKAVNTSPVVDMVSVYAGGNYTVVDSGKIAILFDIDNRDPERAAAVNATCIVNYDQNQRFLFQSTPTPPDTISGTLIRSGNGNKFQAMWPGQNTGFLMFNRGNAAIDHIECKTDSFEMIEEVALVKFLKSLFAQM